jgi:hypothetical protein
VETFPRNLPQFIDSIKLISERIPQQIGKFSLMVPEEFYIYNAQRVTTHVGGPDPDVGVVESGWDELILFEDE